jgi:putative transposase
VYRRRPRLNAALYRGLQRYFLTFCTAKRERVFVTSEIVDLVLGRILQCARFADIEVIAYCFMPDHVHLVVQGSTEAADVIVFVHQAKQRSGFDYARINGKRLWQPSYYDRVLRDDEATLSVVRYVCENPVRGGLVESPHDYGFLGSDRFTLDQVLDAVCWQPRRAVLPVVGSPEGLRYRWLAALKGCATRGGGKLFTTRQGRGLG